MDSPRGFDDAFYWTELCQFMFMPEGPWGYLYVAAEQGLAVDEILGRLQGQRSLQPEIRQWRMSKLVDAAAIEAFLAQYAAGRVAVRRRG